MVSLSNSNPARRIHPEVILILALSARGVIVDNLPSARWISNPTATIPPIAPENLAGAEP